MPAIQPARLKIQAAALIDEFSNPEKFIDSLHNLLSLYANRTHRAGETGRILALTPRYDPPGPVLKLIQAELFSPASKNPAESIYLCDRLWQENCWECKLLAASILGWLGIDQAEEILSRIRTWGISKIEDDLKIQIFHHATNLLRKENPELLLQWAVSNLENEAITQQKISIFMLQELAQDSTFTNLPPITQIIASLVRKSEPQIRPYVLTLLERMIVRSPNECAFFLQQTVEGQNNPDAAWFIRKTILKFPPHLQSKLRASSKQIKI